MAVHPPSPGALRGRRALVASALGVTLLATSACAPAKHQAPETPAPSAGAAAAKPARVDVALRDLVLDDGSSVVGALVDRLTTEGVPFDRVLLAGGARKPITAQTLAVSDAAGVHARYAGIITPSLDSNGLSAAEQSLLRAYSDTFNVRVIRTKTDALFPDPTQAAVPQPAGAYGPRYAGSVDGITATVTEAARAGEFGYLTASLAFDPPVADNAMTAVLMERPVGTGTAEYVPLVTAPIRGTKTSGSLLATLGAGKHTEMLVNFSGDESMNQVQVLSHGMLAWLNRGVATSFSRNFFSVQIDDVLLPNAQWSTEGHCEVGRDCPPTVKQLEPIRMVPSDVDALVEWQNANGMKIELGLNGAGAGEYAQAHAGRDPLMEQISAQKAQLRIFSHTWSHLFLGCFQKLLPEDWRCVANPDGSVQWQPLKALRDQFQLNQAFLAKNQLEDYRADEVVTGEHSGLKKQPQQMDDNPNLAPALNAAGIRWVASDASDEMDPRPIGNAMTVPRYPIDLDYNTPTAPQAVSQYNWLHTSKKDGGSGQCETDPADPCVAKIDLTTGFAQVIVPKDGLLDFAHVVSDDARPHFVHQTNLTSERLLYPILEETLKRYRATFAANTPLVNPNMSDAGQQLVNQQAWATGAGTVSATVAGQVVTVTNKGTSDAMVPLSLPDGSVTVVDGRLRDVFGEAYQGQRSAWEALPAGATATYQLASSSGFATTATWPGSN